MLSFFFFFFIIVTQANICVLLLSVTGTFVFSSISHTKQTRFITENPFNKDYFHLSDLQFGTSSPATGNNCLSDTSSGISIPLNNF